MRAAVVLVAAALAAPGAAQSPEALFPAAQCAAFVLGRDDYAKASRFLTRTPGDPALAAAFRAVAVRLNGNMADGIDSFITGQRPQMAFLFEAFIFGQDRQSRDLHDRMQERCDDFALTQPETRALK